MQMHVIMYTLCREGRGFVTGKQTPKQALSGCSAFTELEVDQQLPFLSITVSCVLCGDVAVITPGLHTRSNAAGFGCCKLQQGTGG